MSHDEHAKALGRWLDQPPGTSPPEDVDEDVVQAIFALRPELAPAPRVTADDILASLTRGPLADISNVETPVGAQRAVAEVVPFPGSSPDAETEDSEPAPIGAPKRRGRFLLWVGGTSGVGLAMVAAATLLLVAYPTLERGSTLTAEPAAAPAAQGASPASSMSRSPRSDEAAEAVPAEEAAQDPEPSSTPSPSPRPAAARAAPPKVAEAEKKEVYDMDEGAVVGRSQLIPELSELEADLDAVAAADDQPAAEAEAEPSKPADAGWAGSEEQAADLSGLRARALPSDRSGSAWRSGVDGDTLGRIDDAIAQADASRAAGDRRAAADTLSAAVQPPARAGQHVAALAASDYLALPDASAAAGVAQRGLGLGSANSPERSWLLVVYGDALSALGEVARARDAYEQAGTANLSR